MTAMLEAMKDAAFNDQSDIKNKKPAYSKMKMLPMLEESLSKCVLCVLLVFNRNIKNYDINNSMYNSINTL